MRSAMSVREIPTPRNINLSLFFLLFSLSFFLTPRMHAAPTCSAGSGSCSDVFNGSAGTTLSAYSSSWVRAKGTSDVYTLGNGAITISGANYAYYYNTQSQSETSQITVLPSNASNAYAREACVRVTQGAGGYCVGFGGVSGGKYYNCYLEKGGQEHW